MPTAEQRFVSFPNKYGPYEQAAQTTVGGKSEAYSETYNPSVSFADRAESQASATLLAFKNLSRRFPTETFSGAMVNKIDNIIYSLLRNCTKIETFRKEETQ